MFINRIKITAKDYSTKLSKSLKFYKGDSIHLSFALSTDAITEINSEVVNGYLPLDNDILQCYVLVEGDAVSGTIIENNEILFHLDSYYTREVCQKRIQLVITETVENSQTEVFHSPPFLLEIAEPLGNWKVQGTEAVVDGAWADVDYVALEDDISTTSENSNLYPWRPGDLITSVRLNAMQDAILNLMYEPISISSMVLSRTTAEKGEVISSLQLTWGYNKDIIEQFLNSNPLNNSLRNLVFNNVSSNTTYTLMASDEKTTATKSVSISFLNGRYSGVSEEKVYDSDFILSLDKQLTTSLKAKFTVSPSVGEYIYYCIPTSFGTPTFSVGGFVGGFEKVATIDFENKFGYIEEYNIYKSANSNLGNTVVEVS